jgi:hypothetical protein
MTCLAALALAVTSCQNNPASPPAAAKIKPVTPPHDSSELAALWAQSEAASYEDITGIIVPSIGGVVEGTVPSWDSTCRFVVEIPANALPGTRPVPITIRVPKYTWRTTDSPVIFQLLPDVTFCNGLQATVTIFWPADLKHPELWYTISCLQRSDADQDGVFEYSRSDITFVSNSEPIIPRLTFRVPHFSRWHAENGKNTGP